MKINYLTASITGAIFVAALGSSVALADDSQTHSASAMAAVSDTSITATVKAKYLEDTRLKNSAITVTTENGVVTLSGSATSPEASSAASDLAQHVSGVVSVNNTIVTSVTTPSVAARVEDNTRAAAKTTERAVSDSWITTKVKSALLADSVTKGFKISVKTRHHVVSLSGAVDTQASIDEAVHLAGRINGVATVKSSALKIAAN